MERNCFDKKKPKWRDIQGRQPKRGNRYTWPYA